LVIRAHTADKTITVQLDGQPVGNCNLKAAGLFSTCSLPVNVLQTNPSITLSIDAPNHAIDDSVQSLLLADVKLEF